MFAYVGSRTTRERAARGDGITVWHVNETNGQLRLTQTVDDLINPSFLLLHPNIPVLYTVHGDQQLVSAFRVDPSTGRLTFLNQVDCGGRNPVHLAMAPDASHLIISNHLSSSLAVLPIAGEGALLPVAQLVQLEGPPGPHRVEQPFAKPHFNPFDRSGRWVLVPDKGVDRVFVFRFENGRLAPAPQPFVQSREGAGPRHLAFHPSGPWVYVVNELDSTVTAYRFDSVTGVLQPFQTMTTLANTFTGHSRASEIEVARSGRSLFASNRGEDSLAVFDIDLKSGALTHRVNVPCAGRTPRFFCISPSNRWLYCLNEDSDSIVQFLIDERDGGLVNTGHSWRTGSPVSMLFSAS